MKQANNSNTCARAHNENTPATPRDLNATPEELELLNQFAALTPQRQVVLLHTINAANANDCQMLKGLKLCAPESSHATMDDLIIMCGGEV